VAPALVNVVSGDFEQLWAAREICRKAPLLAAMRCNMEELGGVDECKGLRRREVQMKQKARYLGCAEIQSFGGGGAERQGTRSFHRFHHFHGQQLRSPSIMSFISACP
jgi:hypothetical protein